LAQLQEAAQCLIGFRESREIDPEAFSRLIYVARSVAAFRPTNLVLFAEKYFMSTVSGVRAVSYSVLFSSFFFSSSRHLSYDVCLEVRGKIIRTVLCYIVY